MHSLSVIHQRTSFFLWFKFPLELKKIPQKTKGAEVTEPGAQSLSDVHANAWAGQDHPASKRLLAGSGGEAAGPSLPPPGIPVGPEGQGQVPD